MKFKYNDRVKFHSTSDANLDGQTGAIVDTATKFDDFNDWIVLMDEPYGDRKAVIITEYCLELTDENRKDRVVLKVDVVIQGDVEVDPVGFIVHKSKDMVAFDLAIGGKYKTAYEIASCDKTFYGTEDTEEPLKNYPCLFVESGLDPEETSTCIAFPEYEGFTVFTTRDGKTLSICLTRY